jgi:hypothetical protein
MTRRLFPGRVLVGLGFACAVALTAPLLLAVASPTAMAAEEEGKQTVRPEIGKPLQAAQQLIKEHKFGEALAKLREADAVEKKTAYEESVLNTLRLIAAANAGEPGVAAKAYDALAGGGSLPAEQRLKFVEAIASAYFQTKDYGSAVTWANRYFAGGGTDMAVRTLVTNAYYLNNDFANAGKMAQELIEQYEHGGQPAPESVLQLLASCALKQNDKKGYAVALEKLVAAYPNANYWADLIHQTTAKAGFPERLSLDVFRLEAAVGTLSGVGSYMEFAELAIQAGLPAEAKAVVEKGYAAGVLGTGTEAERHGRLRDMAKRSTDADQKTLAAGEAEAAKAANGDPMVNNGLDYYGYGQMDKAVALIEQGIAKGNLKYPDDAKLHLGIVFLAAGQKAKAIDAWKSIKSNDAVADLARLWIIKARS